MRRLAAILCIALGGGISPASAIDVPLPRPKPAMPKPVVPWREPLSFREAAGADFQSAAMTSEMSACRQRLEKTTKLNALPRLIGPGSCGGADMVELEAVLLEKGRRIEIKPAPAMRCEMAEQFALWVREDVVTRVATAGLTLASVETYDNYNCRGRNRVFGAKISEHGKGNAVDVRGITFTDKKSAMLTDKTFAKDVRTDLRASACARFTTVLGPGSDGYHEEHIHLDFAQRRGGYRICQWNVLEPPPPPPPPKPPEAEVAKLDAKPEPAKPEAAKPEATKPETAKPEVTKPEGAKPHIARLNPARPDAAKPGAKIIEVPPQAADEDDDAADAADAAEPAKAAPARMVMADVPLPRARPKAKRRSSRPAIHFPFNLLR